MAYLNLLSKTVLSGSEPDMVLPPDPYFAVIQAVMVLTMFTIFGHIRDFLRWIKVLNPSPTSHEKDRVGYVPLYNSFESFYRRNVMIRAIDLFAVPIASMAGPIVKYLDREIVSDFGIRFTGKIKPMINLASYNYLEMNQREGPTATAVQEAITTRGVSNCSPYQELGKNDLTARLESNMANFLGVEDSLIIGMGFATNTSIIPSILKSGLNRPDECLVLSDEKNHASIALGCKLSGCVVRPFKHNDMTHLEELLKTGILEGNSRTRRPFKKIMIIVEGVYSMEGTIVNLPEVIRLKKKYKAYVYLDEAHSIGCIGQTGRGVCELLGVDHKDVDILMGTFTKSFGAAGGYVAGTKTTVDYLRRNSPSTVYATSMAPAVLQQVISSLDILASGSPEGQSKLKQLRENTSYFRKRLLDNGYFIIGHEASPVVPLMIYNPCVGMYLVRRLRESGIGVVVVGFPATELSKSRIRFCLSAGHTKKQLDTVIDLLNEFAEPAGVFRTKKPIDAPKKAIRPRFSRQMTISEFKEAINIVAREAIKPLPKYVESPIYPGQQMPTFRDLKRSLSVATQETLERRGLSRMISRG